MNASRQALPCILAACLMTATAMLGCDSKPSQPATPTAATPTATLPDGLFLTKPPEGQPVNVGPMLAAASNGDKVVVSAVVGGRKEPFVPNRAAVLIIDQSVPSCAEEGDHCETPWDYCCTPAEQLRGQAVLMQVPDAAGRPLPTSLQMAGGLAPLKAVVVEGTVRKDESGSVVIDAAGIYVQP